VLKNLTAASIYSSVLREVIPIYMSCLSLVGFLGSVHALLV
jgi:hypothetical protein